MYLFMYGFKSHSITFDVIWEFSFFKSVGVSKLERNKRCPEKIKATIIASKKALKKTATKPPTHLYS